MPLEEAFTAFLCQDFCLSCVYYILYVYLLTYSKLLDLYYLIQDRMLEGKLVSFLWCS